MITIKLDNKKINKISQKKARNMQNVFDKTFS